ncbi:MAG TPA: aspartate carbamoyltransferase [archaeon]|nr:aspartate carbamoyltransferase [archaeon]
MKGHLAAKPVKKANSNHFLSDVISISDFSRQTIELVLTQAAKLEKMPREKKAKILQNKLVATLFLEPSTRTRLSFESAAQNLGAKVVSLSEPQTSSLSKGESFSDTIKMANGYADIIVVRHSFDGAARRAAEVCTKPIVNAGDGANQHPSQTLLDLYTIYKEFGKIDGLKIMMAGDLKYGRTVHSLMYALSHFKDVTVYLYSPVGLEMPKYIIEETKNLKIHQTNNLEKFIPNVDIIYATRIQKERFPDELEYQKVKNAYVITNELISKAKKGVKIMHPLPRITEIAQEVDSTPAALYFTQAANGIPVREAILSLLQDVKK